jgi:hypothetical protein
MEPYIVEMRQNMQTKLKKQRKVMQVDIQANIETTVEKFDIKMMDPCSTLLFLAIVIENVSVISLINVIIPHLMITLIAV